MNTLEETIRSVEQALLQAEVYFGHGTDNAWDEAVQLVLQAMNLPLDSDRSVASLAVNETNAKQINDYLQQRIQQRLPLPYITHQAWFAGLPFYVDQRVLIPRSPFAEWIERQFEPWIDPMQVSRILEIGTGSGCIAITAALAFPEARVDATDISQDALAVAAKNCSDYPAVQSRIQLLQSDVFEQLDNSARYDIIISNPPYVGAQEMETLPAEYYHEPRLALQTDDQGLQIVEQLLQKAKHYLTAQGILLVEVGNSQSLLQQRYPDLPFIWLEQARGGEGLFLLHQCDL